MYKCNYCGKEYKKSEGRNFGAHKTSCKKNPKREEIDKKISEKRFQGYFKFNCKNCNQEFSLTKSDISHRKSSTKYCSISCSNSNRKSTKSQREKTSKTLKIFYKDKKHKDVNLICQNDSCRKEFVRSYRKSKQKYCSRKCQTGCPKWKNKLSGSKNIGKDNPMYGKSPGHAKGEYVTSTKHTGKKRFYVRSSYEFEYVKILESDDSIIQYTYEPQEYRSYYRYNGVEHSYLPDFLIETEEGLSMVEVKPKRLRSLADIEAKKESFVATFPNIPYGYWSPANK